MTWAGDFFALMVNIMRSVWSTFALITIDGIAVTSIIMVFVCMMIVLGIFWGSRS